MNSFPLRRTSSTSSPFLWVLYPLRTVEAILLNSTMFAKGFSCDFRRRVAAVLMTISGVLYPLWYLAIM